MLHTTGSTIDNEQEATLSIEQIATIADRFDSVDSTLELLAWVLETFPQRWVLASTWQHAVIVDHLARLTDDVRVCELDTELLFPETYTTRDAILERYPQVQVITRRADLTLEEQARTHGPALWARDPDACCRIRKVKPLRSLLREQDAWITGLRRDQSAARSNRRTVEFDRKHGIVKINPLAPWSQQDIDRYIREHDVPSNPLLDQGYSSIGCMPCTSPAATRDEARWAGMSKTECGIHQ